MISANNKIQFISLDKSNYVLITLTRLKKDETIFYEIWANDGSYTSNTFICNTNDDDRFIITSKVYKGVVYFLKYTRTQKDKETKYYFQFLNSKIKKNIPTGDFTRNIKVKITPKNIPELPNPLTVDKLILNEKKEESQEVSEDGFSEGSDKFDTLSNALFESDSAGESAGDSDSVEEPSNTIIGFSNESHFSRF